MRMHRRIVLVGALGVMLGAIPASELAGQSATLWQDARPSFESFYTQIRFDGDERTMNAEGMGARLMWSPAATEGRSTLAGRTGFGVFATYTPEHAFGPSFGFSSLSVGAVADVRPFEYPLAGRVDPFLSLGTGVLHTNVSQSIAPAPAPILAGSKTAFTLVPGIGTRLLLTPNLALQGDVRDLMTFRGDTRHNVAFGAGLRLSF
ncbi:MAG TPA: hypothetical protein VFS08_04735 [Gemmatimonadaceae bacterium]|nr:hypothetical protein [Gemmatimonadaceae bacterium]